MLSMTSGIAKKNGGTPEGARQGNQLMLNILERESDGKVEPEFTDRELKASRDYLTRKIARAEASGQPFAEIVTIDPALAHLLLQRNPADENRKLSLATVEKYAADMAAGRWQGMNGQTIVISKDGYLNDGQHRLNAVIACRGNIPFTVVFGAERETRLTLDQNKVRTSGDYIGMAGIKNPNNVAAAAAILYAYDNNSLATDRYDHAAHSDDRPTKAALHKYALEHLEEIEGAIVVANSAQARRISTTSRLAAAICLIARKAGAEDASAFVASVIAGNNLGKTNPAFQVRERLIEEKVKGHCPIGKTIEIVLVGWNKHRLGNRNSRLSTKGFLPEIEG